MSLYEVVSFLWEETFYGSLPWNYGFIGGSQEKLKEKKMENLRGLKWKERDYPR